MKWTTANIKHPSYTVNHELFVGSDIGSFKKLLPASEEAPFVSINLQDMNELEIDSSITALEFGDVDKTNILIGRKHSKVQLYTTVYERVQHEVDMRSSHVVGLARFNEQLIVGFASGNVKCSLLEHGYVAETHTISAGNNMSHLRQCQAQRNLVATGGKERQNNLKVFDVEAGVGKPIFTSKNVPPDFLQLEVPVWDSDVGFIDGPHTLATCSHTGYVRVYDTRKQRRPVQCYYSTSKDKNMSFSNLVANGNYIYAGCTMGQLKAFDIRKMKNFVHTYKGFTGAVSDLCLDETGKYLASSSIDRYVRVHDVDSTQLLYQCYVQSKATRILIRTVTDNPNAQETENVAKKLKKKSSSNKACKSNELSEDEEYEELFDQMQTIK